MNAAIIKRLKDMALIPDPFLLQKFAITVKNAHEDEGKG
jgi:hypothetical protein